MNLYRERKEWLASTGYRIEIEVEEMGFIRMGKQGPCFQGLQTLDTVEDLHLTAENGQCVPITPGGMVDVAVHELGAKIVKVELLEEEELEVTFERN